MSNNLKLTNFYTDAKEMMQQTFATAKYDAVERYTVCLLYRCSGTAAVTGCPAADPGFL